jgi:hypothetical protein
MCRVQLEAGFRCIGCSGGADDPLRAYSRDLAARWPGSKHVEMPATDHATIPASPRLLEEVRLLAQANPQPNVSGR